LNPRPEVAPLLGYARSAIRKSLQALRPPTEQPAEEQPAGEGELSDEEKLQLEQHYQTLK